MGEVEIVVVETDAQMTEFIDLPWRFYNGSEQWVPPIKYQVRRLLDPAKHPFWKFAERVLILARRDQETVGRIAAIVDSNYNHRHEEKTAKWGFFECEENAATAAALFKAAEDWSRSKGMTALHGPMNPSMNYDVGLLVEGFENPPAVSMPYNPPYYRELVESCGFQQEKDLIAFLWKRGNKLSPRVERLAKRESRNPAIRIRSMERSALREEVRLIKEIYEEAWQDNWGFVPMTPEETAEMAGFMKWVTDTDLSFFVYYEDQPAAVCLMLKDINPLLKKLNGSLGLVGLFKGLLFRNEIKGARLVLFGIRKAYQKLKDAFPFVALERLHRLCEQKHEYVELGWVLDDNEAIKQMAVELGARLHKRYSVFRKSL